MASRLGYDAGEQPAVASSPIDTAAVEDFVDDSQPETGLPLCGVYNEAGYHDFIYAGNTGHTYPPPSLVIEYTEGTVPTRQFSFDAVETLYRQSRGTGRLRLHPDPAKKESG